MSDDRYLVNSYIRTILSNGEVMLDVILLEDRPVGKVSADKVLTNLKSTDGGRLERTSSVMADAEMPVDPNGNPIPVLGDEISQDVDFDGNVQSAAVAATTRIVRLCATQDCRYKIGADPMALATSAYLPAKYDRYVKIKGGEKVAAIKDPTSNTAGKLNIVECS